ncbi:hypothetical protein PIIN_02981 [Serendipita indica DSM 11827]|uniref:Diphthamide biosynthesis protein 3 n=1 Tax=Serendipita indica (strain DSM 11827) TaxID=1109443 RepID=G4U2D8_SERID|nr:hypothetical protein PIIN_02981 [Serendipita indica DSM 11827]
MSSNSKMTSLDPSKRMSRPRGFIRARSTHGGTNASNNTKSVYEKSSRDSLAAPMRGTPILSTISPPLLRFAVRARITPRLGISSGVDSVARSPPPRKFVWSKMVSYYDEIEIEDMVFDDVKGVYHYPCPCGDRFEISRAQLANYEDIATCPSCSLVIRVIYDPLDFEDEEDAASSTENESESEESNKKA